LHVKDPQKKKKKKKKKRKQKSANLEQETEAKTSRRAKTTKGETAQKLNKKERDPKF
jgi:hypothetical protein